MFTARSSQMCELGREETKSLFDGVLGGSVGLTVSAESFKPVDNHSLLIGRDGAATDGCRDCVVAWFRHCPGCAWVATRLNTVYHASDRSVRSFGSPRRRRTRTWTAAADVSRHARPRWPSAGPRGYRWVDGGGLVNTRRDSESFVEERSMSGDDTVVHWHRWPL